MLAIADQFSAAGCHEEFAPPPLELQNGPQFFASVGRAFIMLLEQSPHVFRLEDALLAQEAFIQKLVHYGTKLAFDPLVFGARFRHQHPVESGRIEKLFFIVRNVTCASQCVDFWIEQSGMNLCLALSQMANANMPSRCCKQSTPYSS